MSKNTGGPAFPNNPVTDSTHFQYPPTEGMTLRDYFAGQAVNGLMSNDASVARVYNLGDKTIAQACYEIADAMIKERAK